MQNRSARHYRQMISIMKESSTLKKLAAFAVAILLWQIAAGVLNQKILLASPIAVFMRLLVIWTEEGFLSTIWFSFIRIVGGFLCALLIGTLLAVLSSRARIIEIFLMPYMVTIKSVPVASFIIISLVWLSSAQLSIFISFLMVLPIVYTNVLNGIKSVDVKMLEMAEVFRLSWRKKFLYILLPQMKPFVLAACSVSLGLSWKAGIAAEVIGIPRGSVGEMLYEAKVYLNTVDLFAWTVLIVAISLAFEKVFMLLLRRLFARLERV